MKKIIIVFLFFVTVSCKSQNNVMKDTPIVTVIKLQSSEALLNFNEAKRYIDIEKVYGKNPESKNPQKEWQEMVTFFYNLGNNNKFTSQFKYFNYDITEIIESSKSKVKFKSINKDSQIKEIIYTLDKLNNNWIVVDIEYVN